MAGQPEPGEDEEEEDDVIDEQLEDADRETAAVQEAVGRLDQLRRTRRDGESTERPGLF